MTISRAEYEALQAKVHAQKQELEGKSQELVAALLKNQWLLEQLRLNRKKQYGSSSEQLDQLVFEQFGRVFNEAEAGVPVLGSRRPRSRPIPGSHALAVWKRSSRKGRLWSGGAPAGKPFLP